MIEETQTIQDQTGQPAPQTQVPQSTEEATIQQTVDQQALESSTGTIRVPGADEQATATVERTTTEPISNEPGFDIGIGLLIAVFVLAISLVCLIAWAAIRHTKRQTATEEEPPMSDLEAHAQQKRLDDELDASLSSKKPQKKLTRRQRKQAQQKRD